MAMSCLRMNLQLSTYAEEYKWLFASQCSLRDQSFGQTSL